MADHKITVHSEDGIWLLGAVDDYPFEAKVCDEASGFGIDCGRVIKLHIRGKQASWDRFPKGAHKGLARAVIRFCESLPEQEIWRGTFLTERHFLVTEDDVLEYE